MIYVDSSALLKLLFEEDESDTLRRWLTAHASVAVVSSELARVEVSRVCRRIDSGRINAARALLAGLDLIPMTSDVINEAAEMGSTMLRSLDAIHLSTALSIREDLTALVAYDRRLSDAATAAGIETVRPCA